MASNFQGLLKLSMPMGLYYLVGQLDETWLAALVQPLKGLAVGVLVLCLYVCIRVRQTIVAAADERPVTVAKEEVKKKKKKKAKAGAAGGGPAPPAAVEGGEAAGTGGDEVAPAATGVTAPADTAAAAADAGPGFEVITTQEFDLREWRKLVVSSVGGSAISAIMPLLGFGARSTLPALAGTVINMLDHQLVKIHWFGREDVGELARPWKAAESVLAQTRTEMNKAWNVRETVEREVAAEESDRLARETSKLARMMEKQAASGGKARKR